MLHKGLGFLQRGSLKSTVTGNCELKVSSNLWVLKLRPNDTTAVASFISDSISFFFLNLILIFIVHVFDYFPL